MWQQAGHIFAPLPNWVRIIYYSFETQTCVLLADNELVTLSFYGTLITVYLHSNKKCG